MSDPLHQINLVSLMARTEGRPEVTVGLIDGPVALDHPALAPDRARVLNGAAGAACSHTNSAACRHGTLVAGVLAARRASGASAICPGCTLLVRPVFAEPSGAEAEGMPQATPAALAAALLDCLYAGAHVINLSAALVRPSLNAEQALGDALNLAARRSVLVVAAAGNQGAVGGSPITRHPWVLAVAACDEFGRPLPYTNLSGSIGGRGLLAPGRGVVGLDSAGGTAPFDGTSAAAPLVSGAAALLLSEFPYASGAAVRHALLSAAGPRRASVVPPMLDAGAAYQTLLNQSRRAA